MRFAIRCCRECEDRHTACHSTCEKYIAARKAFDEEKEAIRQAKKVESDYLYTRFQSISPTALGGRMGEV